jgi:hypothetical protein
VIHVVGRAPLAARHHELQGFCDKLAADGAVLVLREADAPAMREDELMCVLDGDLDVARTFVRDRTRVSLIGALSHGGPDVASALADPACGAFAMFCLGRGRSGVMLIDPGGLVQAAPCISA